MSYKILFTKDADKDLTDLEKDLSRKNILKAVMKTLAFMEINLRHPSLNSHEFRSQKGPLGQKIFEVYVKQNTAGAYRIFWYYGPLEKQLTIVAIVPHPRDNQKNV